MDDSNLTAKTEEDILRCLVPDPEVFKIYGGGLAKVAGVFL
jgi:hypothetical protein